MAATPGIGAEPDEEKLMNRLKSELAEEDSTMGKLLDHFSFGLLIEAGAALAVAGTGIGILSQIYFKGTGQ